MSRVVGLYMLLGLMAAAIANADTIDSQNLSWNVTPGVNTVESSANCIHIRQTVAKNTKDYALLTTSVDLKDYANWSLSCDLRLGKRASAGSFLTLKSAGRVVMLAGGDSWNTQGPVVILGGRQVLTLTRDNDWHHIDLQYAQGVASITVDSIALGRIAVLHSPDTIDVGATNPDSGQQTEIYVRDITIIKNHKLVASASTPSPSDHSPTLQPSSKAGIGGTPPTKTSEPRTLATQSKGLVPVTSDSALKLSKLTIRYRDTYAGRELGGMKCELAGVWMISVELVNDSDKPITVIPGVLNFDNRKSEELYTQGDIVPRQHGAMLRTDGKVLLDPARPEIFYCPVAGKNPLICLEPGKRTAFDLFSENGGGWNVDRKPVSLSMLCLGSEDLQKAQGSLEHTYAIDSSLETSVYHQSLGLLVYSRALDWLRRGIKPPPPKDPLWVNIPINSQTLTLGSRNAK